MKKLILLTTALVVASGASAYAQGEHSASKHRRWMSSHAQMWEEPPVTIYRSLPPAMIAPPPYGYYGGGYYGGAYGGYGRMDDPEAEGRTSG
jgi:hypothetical protein